MCVVERKKREKLWIGVWMRKNERGGELVEDEREILGEQ